MAVVGSVNYPGAAYLSCAAMGRVGAGLVTGAIPQPVWVPVSSALAEPTWILLSHDLGVVNEAAAANVTAKLGEYDALLIGCGLGQEERHAGLYGAAAAEKSQTATVGIAGRVRGIRLRDSRTKTRNRHRTRILQPTTPFGTIRRRDQLPAEERQYCRLR